VSEPEEVAKLAVEVDLGIGELGVCLGVLAAPFCFGVRVDIFLIIQLINLSRAFYPPGLYDGLVGA
jgi:hypothetical protein